MSAFTNMFRFFSGHLISPAYFGLLGLVAVVILLYLLKLRRTEIVISSTMFWRKSLDDLTANAPFQRLRYNLLLLLQILIMMLIIGALARPFIITKGIAGNNVALIIDRSASMQTMENGRSRLDLAKEAALKMVGDLSSGDKMMLVAFAEKSEVLCELTDDRSRLRQAINAIHAFDTRSNIRDVVLMARSLTPDNPDVPSAVPRLKLVLIGDGRVSDLNALGALAVDLDFLQVGETPENAGITAFSVRDSPGVNKARSCLVSVHNESPTALDTTLSLYMGDSLLAAEEIKVSPAGDTDVVFELPELSEGLLRAEIDHKDALEVDNRAWLSLHSPPVIKVLLVAKGDSTGAYFLKRVLTLDPRVELSAVEQANYVETANYDLTIFENWSPVKLPQGSAVFINVVPPTLDVKADGALENPPILAKDAKNPIMRFVDPANIFIRQAIKIILPAGAGTLLSTGGGPLIADLSRGGKTIIVIAFDLADTNWPLHLSFPLFIQNLLSAVPRAAQGGEDSISSGHPLAIMPVPGVGFATVTKPDGASARIDLDPLRPVYFGDTETAGVYSVRVGSKDEQYAVNLLDKNESSITPAPSLKIGRGEAVAERGFVRRTRELWRWLILAGIIMLGVEWWIYGRRAWM